MALRTDVMIPLKGGFTVPESVVVWMLGAEDRGLSFRLTDDGRLWAGPAERVAAADDAFIREHRETLIACVTYIEQMCEAPL